MTIKLISCGALRPDRRAISRTIEDIADDVDANLAAEYTDILLAGSPVEVDVSFNQSSAYRALRKLDIDYEIID
ncbi:hypothetical protein [Lewinella sp. JB7]|uniref:hypothetical protein n=1 Tax=Lewinella sp. JB7 TaxID=2962887 RepID=UPI0020CA0F72|nr:hypothetical protein [Lewinella sp. JB7]MCP9235545.1 hypothetical protein [Lewinella sp. JB7]